MAEREGVTEELKVENQMEVGWQNEHHSQRRYGSSQQRGDFRMRTSKYYLYLTDDENTALCCNR